MVRARRSTPSSSRSSKQKGMMPVARRRRQGDAASAAPPTISSACRRRRRRSQAFVDDNSPDAFAKVVDRLLASPHYGERWGRHWLDTARYADTIGGDRQQPRATDYRYRLRLDLSRLRDQGVQRRHAVRPVHHRAARRGPAARHEQDRDASRRARLPHRRRALPAT